MDYTSIARIDLHSHKTAHLVLDEAIKQAVIQSLQDAERKGPFPITHPRAGKAPEIYLEITFRTGSERKLELYLDSVFDPRTRRDWPLKCSRELWKIAGYRNPEEGN